MRLDKIEDPRSTLDKARRRELADFAKEHGVTEITPDMPAILMRDILRNKGLTRIVTPQRTLGETNQPGTGLKYQNRMQDAHQTQSKGVEADAIADLKRQYQQESAQPAVKAVADMSITELRQACKAKGIKMVRKDNMETLRAKLGQNAS